MLYHKSKGKLFWPSSEGRWFFLSSLRFSGPKCPEIASESTERVTGKKTLEKKRENKNTE